MKVVVPYVRLHPALRPALERDGIEARYAATYGPTDFWHLLRDTWLEQETFVWVEQDKIPDAGAVEALFACPEPWCVYPVPMRGTENSAEIPSLSCTKFDRQLMLRWPNLVDEAGRIDLGYGERDWHRLDAAVAALLQIAGARPHWHEPGRIRHLHEEAA